MKRFALLLSLITVIFTMFGCESDSTSLTMQGSMTGRASLHDQDMVELSDHSGIKVELEGTGRSTVTDAKGDWTFENIPAGIYILTMTKTGFGTMKNTSLQFVGNGTAYIDGFDLYEIPTFTVTLDSIVLGNNEYQTVREYDEIIYIGDSVSGNIYDTVHRVDTLTFPRVDDKLLGTVSTAAKLGKYMNLYFSRTPTIDIHNESSYIYLTVLMSSYSSTIINQPIFRSELRKAGFAQGETVYIQAYPTVYSGPNVSTYFDIKTRRTIYTGVSQNGSNVISFVMP